MGRWRRSCTTSSPTRTPTVCSKLSPPPDPRQIPRARAARASAHARGLALRHTQLFLRDPNYTERLAAFLTSVGRHAVVTAPDRIDLDDGEDHSAAPRARAVPPRVERDPPGRRRRACGLG